MNGKNVSFHVRIAPCCSRRGGKLVAFCRVPLVITIKDPLFGWLRKGRIQSSITAWLEAIQSSIEKQEDQCSTCCLMMEGNEESLIWIIRWSTRNMWWWWPLSRLGNTVSTSKSYELIGTCVWWSCLSCLVAVKHLNGSEHENNTLQPKPILVEHRSTYSFLRIK